MRRIYTSSFVMMMVFCCQTIFAQQTYQLSDYGGPGTIYLYNRLAGVLPTQEVSKTGENITWDLSANGDLNTHPNQIVSPSQAIDQVTFLTICSVSGISFLECFTIWSQTEQALLLKDSVSLFGFTLVDLQRYQNKTNNLLLENFFGFTVDFTGEPTQAVIVYQSPDTIFHFPIAYSNSWTSDVDWMIDLSAIGQNIMYKSNQNRTSEVDAWGTLMTPYDTFTNVIRLRSEIEHQDTLYTDSLAVPVNITQLEYMWFDTAYKLPVMVANGVVQDSFEIINSIEYIYEATCATPTWTVTLDSDDFFTDSTGSVTVDFQIENGNANTYTWDFGDGTTETTDGSVSHTYSATGTYVVEVSGCMTNCLPLNSCTSQQVDFNVLVSVDAVSGDELGIKLYPNPARELLHVEIPSGLEYTDYQILNSIGQIIGKGNLNTTSIPVHNFSDGIYTLRLAAKNGSSFAIMRFTISK
jgi:hypothetical protein